RLVVVLPVESNCILGPTERRAPPGRADDTLNSTIVWLNSVGRVNTLFCSRAIRSSWLDNRKLQPVPTPQLSVAPIWREISAQAGSPVSSAYIVCNLNVALLLVALVSRSVVSFWLAASVNVHRSCV